MIYRRCHHELKMKRWNWRNKRRSEKRCTGGRVFRWKRGKKCRTGICECENAKTPTSSDKSATAISSQWDSLSAMSTEQYVFILYLITLTLPPEHFFDVQTDRHSDFFFKILLIGDSGVGKSCLLLRFAVSYLVCFPSSNSPLDPRYSHQTRETRDLHVIISKIKTVTHSWPSFRRILGLKHTLVPSVSILWVVIFTDPDVFL